jgi:hypothetical protein
MKRVFHGCPIRQVGATGIDEEEKEKRKRKKKKKNAQKECVQYEMTYQPNACLI